MLWRFWDHQLPECRPDLMIDLCELRVHPNEHLKLCSAFQIVVGNIFQRRFVIHSVFQIRESKGFLDNRLEKKHTLIGCFQSFELHLELTRFQQSVSLPSWSTFFQKQFTGFSQQRQNANKRRVWYLFNQRPCYVVGQFVSKYWPLALYFFMTVIVLIHASVVLIKCMDHWNYMIW